MPIAIWAILFVGCLLLLEIKLSSDDLVRMDSEVSKAQYTSEEDVEENNEGESITEVIYSKIGKRKTTLSLISIGLLLIVFFTKPFYSVQANTVVFILNFFAMMGLLGSLIEGWEMWAKPKYNPFENGGE